VAHAEASARTVAAAVAAAADQLGLRSDQVDVEVLEEPVPSTFGYVGAPARVRVTPRAAGAGAGSGEGSEGPGMAEGGSERVRSDNGPAVGGSEPVRTGTEPAEADRLVAQESSTQANTSNVVGASGVSGSASVTPTAPAQAPAADTGNGQVTTDLESQAADQAAGEAADRSGQTQAESVASHSPTEPAISPTGASVVAPATPAAPDAADAIAAPGSPASAVPVGSGASSSSPPAPSVPATDATVDAGSGSAPRATRPPRRTYKDEPIEPQMVEEDTERAGDFLEGLLDALDVDGDITTWVDEVGGHIDLEGADLDVLVGSNGETLDALQELTRLAVLRQSKRRVRLLIDINGFRARQREQLTAMVQAKVEEVIQTREDHEFQPMTPAERKVVHDAVAAMEGVRTESLGEEPNRRVVIRPT
jgi:spoIIIJ-associated protein